MKWISVEEALPVIPEGKYGIKVIVAMYDATYAECTGVPESGYDVTTMRYGSVKNRHGEWLSEEFTDWPTENDFMELCIGGERRFLYMPSCDPITHWMYMPECPHLDSIYETD